MLCIPIAFSASYAGAINQITSSLSRGRRRSGRMRVRIVGGKPYPDQSGRTDVNRSGNFTMVAVWRHCRVDRACQITQPASMCFAIVFVVGFIMGRRRNGQEGKRTKRDCRNPAQPRLPLDVLVSSFSRMNSHQCVKAAFGCSGKAWSNRPMLATDFCARGRSVFRAGHTSILALNRALYQRVDSPGKRPPGLGTEVMSWCFRLPWGGRNTLREDWSNSGRDWALPNSALRQPGP